MRESNEKQEKQKKADRDALTRNNGSRPPWKLIEQECRETEIIRARESRKERRADLINRKVVSDEK